MQPRKPNGYSHYIFQELTMPRDKIKVLFVGAGGTGSILLAGLARINHALVSLGHPGMMVYVFDGDDVSEANLARQLFSKSDLGLNKATVQVTRINSFFGVNWSSQPMMFTQRTLSKADLFFPLVISAVDNARARIVIRKAIKDKALYWLDTGNTFNTGQTILGTLKKIDQPKKRTQTIDFLPTVIDLYPDIESMDTDSLQGPSCSLEASLQRQSFFINQHIATSALRLIWDVMRKGCLTKAHGYIVNFESSTIERALPIDPEAWERIGYPQNSRKKKNLKVISI